MPEDSISDNDKLKEQKARAELELDLLDLERKIAEKRKEIFASKIFDPDVATLEGKTTLDTKADLESRVLSYKAIGEIASEIALEVGRVGSEKVMVYSESHLEMVAFYRSFVIQLKLLRDEYESALKVEDEVITKIKGRAREGGLEVREFDHLAAIEREELKRLTSMAAKTVISTVAPIAMKSFMDIASLFKSDTDITFSKFDLVADALLAEVASYLKKDGVEVIYPPAIVNAPEIIITTLFDLNLLKERAKERLAHLSVEDGPDPLKERITVLSTHHDNLIEALKKTPDGGSESVLEKLIKAESIALYLEKGETDLLALKPVYAGGNNRVKRRLFSSKITHSGGAIITFILSSPNGGIKSSKTFYNYTGYRSFKNPKKRISDLNNFSQKVGNKKLIKFRAEKDEESNSF